MLTNNKSEDESKAIIIKILTRWLRRQIDVAGWHLLRGLPVR